MKADGDPLASSYSFLEVVTASEYSPKPLRHLKSRCLRPGEYAGHLERWLDYYPSTQVGFSLSQNHHYLLWIELPFFKEILQFAQSGQINFQCLLVFSMHVGSISDEVFFISCCFDKFFQMLIVDGDVLRSDPIAVMHHLQRFAKIKPFADYRELIRFDKKKGFYCQITSNDSSKCLGRGKGRRYAPMDSQAEAILQRHYQPHNVALHKLLVRLNQPVPLPKWLKADLS